jgi:hypothetical protein
VVPSRKPPLSDHLTRPLRRLLGCLGAGALVGVIAAVIPVSSAQADVIGLGTCNASALTQPFTPWLDGSSYELAPGGDFESPGWTLNGAAQLVAGSETYAATGTLGDQSLSLPAGSSAESPSTCVDAAYPTARFFIAGSGAVALSVIDGNLNIPAGVAVASGGWQPTPVMLTDSALMAAGSGGTAQVSLEITALSGDPQVDDVFIDPWNRG